MPRYRPGELSNLSTIFAATNIASDMSTIPSAFSRAFDATFCQTITVTRFTAFFKSNRTIISSYEFSNEAAIFKALCATYETTYFASIPAFHTAFFATFEFSNETAFFKALFAAVKATNIFPDGATILSAYCNAFVSSE